MEDRRGPFSELLITDSNPTERVMTDSKSSANTTSAPSHSVAKSSGKHIDASLLEFYGMDDGALRARLDALGVVAWDIAPPEQGRIRFMDRSGSMVAHARFRVILSYGPGDIYTMGWSIAAYRTAGIPFVGREEAGEPAVVHRASREEAWQRGQEIAAKIGAQG